MYHFLFSYFQEVLNSPNLSADTNEIQLNKDGSWSTHVLSNDTQSLDTPCKRFQKVQVISDDLGKQIDRVSKISYIPWWYQLKLMVGLAEVIENMEPEAKPAAQFSEPTSTTTGVETSVSISLNFT